MRIHIVDCAPPRRTGSPLTFKCFICSSSWRLQRSSAPPASCAALRRDANRLMVDLDEDAQVASPTQMYLISIDRQPRSTIRLVTERHASHERHIFSSTGFMLLASSAGQQLTGEHQVKRRRRGEAAYRWVRSIGSLGRCTQHCPVICAAPPLRASQIRSVGLGLGTSRGCQKQPTEGRGGDTSDLMYRAV